MDHSEENSMDQYLLTPEDEPTDEELLAAIEELMGDELWEETELIGDELLEETDTDEEWASSA